jgi:hypothetical protein
VIAYRVILTSQGNWSGTWRGCCTRTGRQVGARRGTRKLTRPFHLVRDQSKTIARHITQLLNLDELSPVTPIFSVGALPVIDIAFADSATSPQLRIEDWVAGAGRQATQSAATGRGNAFVDRLTPAVESWMIEAYGRIPT